MRPVNARDLLSKISNYLTSTLASLSPALPSFFDNKGIVVKSELVFLSGRL